MLSADGDFACISWSVLIIETGFLQETGLVMEIIRCGKKRRRKCYEL